MFQGLRLGLGFTVWVSSIVFSNLICILYFLRNGLLKIYLFIIVENNVCTPVDFCRNLPCQNNGVCLSMFNGYICVCLAGYGGARCEYNVNECASRPCLNNGICIDNVDGYTCNCTMPGTGGMDYFFKESNMFIIT